MRRKIKKMDCIEYLSVQAPLEKVNMLEDKQSKYIHEFVKDAKACYKVNQLVLVNLDIIDEYLETFHIVDDEFYK